MFSLFRKKRSTFDPNPAVETASILRQMEFTLTPYGAGVAIASHLSGYSPHETASLIASTTIALDVKESGANILRVMKIAAHGGALIPTLTRFKDHKLMREAIWRNDSRAILGAISVNAEQRGWIEKVLSDPIAGKERMANSLMDYGSIIVDEDE